jgi:hypothetical protein
MSNDKSIGGGTALGFLALGIGGVAGVVFFNFALLGIAALFYVLIWLGHKIFRWETHSEYLAKQKLQEEQQSHINLGNDFMSDKDNGGQRTLVTDPVTGQSKVVYVLKAGEV